MRPESPRLAVRAIILHQDHLLMVNAYPDGKSNLLCAPGGGVEAGSSLPDNLKREVFEETGLAIDVGLPCLVNEFHDPKGTFHQVDVYFRCTLTQGAEIAPDWKDPEGIVTQWHWLNEAALAQNPHKPDSLSSVAFDPTGALTYDPLEPIVT